MKKTLKYIGAAFIFIGALILAAIGILMLTVIVGLLTNEHSHMEEEPAQVESASISPVERTRGINWNQQEDARMVLFQNGAEQE